MKLSQSNGNIPIEVLSDNQVPEQAFGKDISEKERQRLKLGKYSSVIKDVTDLNGVKRDLRFKIAIDVNNNPVILTTVKKEHLVIPEQFNNQTILKEEENILKNGGIIGPYIVGSNEYYLTVDKDFNSIFVLNSEDFNLPSEIDNYVLTKKDKLYLVNGIETEPILFHNEDENIYYTSSVKLTENKEIVFSSAKRINPIKGRLSSNNSNQTINYSKINYHLKEYGLNSVLLPDADEQITLTDKIALSIENHYKVAQTASTKKQSSDSLKNIEHDLPLLKTTVNLSQQEEKIYSQILNGDLKSVNNSVSVSHNLKTAILESNLSLSEKNKALTYLKLSNQKSDKLKEKDSKTSNTLNR